MPESSSARPSRGQLTPARRRLLDRLLDQLLDLPEAERSEQLQQLLQHHPRMGDWLRRLLQALGENDPRLESAPRTLVDQAIHERFNRRMEPLPRGTLLGPWRLLERVGTGGMGEVYRAERADGSFEMQVAIKLIQSKRADLAQLLEQERQTLANLNHPAIARLLDGGLSEDGRPYLVMDWVEGPTLDWWLRIHRPTMNKRLTTFIELCDAVAAAHRQLVVHGDIKPTNLAITRDHKVRLLDFGVARLLGQDDLPGLPTAITPKFSAPEVLEGASASTAFDIYSLGVLLRWITEDQELDRRQRRNLGAIIEQATAQDAALRYPTVNALGADVWRMLEHHPLRARRTGAFERARLWVRRHRLAALLALATALSLVIGMSAVLWQARIAAMERDHAQAEALQANALRDHLALLFREVGSLSDDTETLTARELFDRSASVAGDWLDADPDMRGQVNTVLGGIMIALGDYAAAEPMLSGFASSKEAVNHPMLRAIAILDMAQVHHRMGRMEEGLEEANLGLEILESTSDVHPARLSDALQVRGRLRRDLGDRQGALEDLRRARRLARSVSSGPRPLLARAESNLAITLVLSGELALAARHLEAAEALWLALNYGESSDALAVTANLASVLDRLGRSSEAEQRLRRVIEIRSQRYGDSGAMAAARLNLGRQLVVTGEYEEAEQQLLQAASIFSRFIGEETPDFAAAQFGLGELAEAQNELVLAEARYQQALELMTSRLGPSHPYSMQMQVSLTRVLHRRQPSQDTAERYAEIASQAAEMGSSWLQLRAGLACDQASLALDQGQTATAFEYASDCLKLRQQLDYGGWRLQEARVIVALIRAAEGDISDSLEKLVLELTELTRADHPLVLQAQKFISP